MFLFGKKKPKKEKRRIPKTVQQSIPIDRLYKDEIYLKMHDRIKNEAIFELNKLKELLINLSFCPNRRP